MVIFVVGVIVVICIFDEKHVIMTFSFPHAYQFKSGLQFVVIIFLALLFPFFLYSQQGDSLDIYPYEQKLELLDSLFTQAVKSDPARSLVIAKKAYRITVGKQDQYETRSIGNLYKAYDRLKKYDSADIYLEKGLLLSSSINDTVDMLEFLTNLGWSYFYRGHYNKATASFSQAISIFDVYLGHHPSSQEINPMNYAKLLNNKATVYFKMGHYDSAIRDYKISLEYRQLHNAGKEYIAPTLQNIGGVCYKNNNLNEALDYFTQAFDLYVDLKDSAMMASLLINMGITQKALGDTTMAIASYEKALALVTKIREVRTQINVLNNLGTAYLQTHEYKKAQIYIQKALDLNNSGRFQGALATSYLYMGMFFLEKKNYNKAFEFGMKCLELSKNLGKRNQLENIYLLLSDASQGLGDLSASLGYFKLHKLMHDSIFNEESRANYNKLQVELETTQKQREIEILKKEQEKLTLEQKIKKTQHTIILVVMVVMILFLVVIVYVVLLKRKKDSQIHHQKELVHKKEKQLALAELEKSKMKEKELEQSVLYKSKQLSTHALHMMQKNSIMQNIQTDIKTLSRKKSSDDKSEYKRINFQINQSLRSDKDWDVFKLYFEDVNRDFYKNLNLINPELTTNDHRLCALIKLNMNSKEMASVLNVAPNSIKSSRYRLKKKLGLDLEADLEEYIRSL
jgi:tetratricopeptide (TPR) repeat protein